MAKSTQEKVLNGELEILAKVEKFEDVTFGHIIMAENILSAIGLDGAMVVEAVKAKM